MSGRRALPPPNTTDVLSRRFSMDVESAAPRAASAPSTAEVDDVALNPLNTRDLTSPRTRAKIREIAESMKVHGQLASCAVVNRGAFLAIFPEYEARVGSATYVQVNGACRRAAAIEAERPDIKIDVMDGLAASRQAFLGATSAENIDRGDFDPIEEALAVELLVKECGSGKEAAERLAKTAPWVTQRRNLLKLAPEAQDALRGDEDMRLPVREVRDWHKLPHQDQLARLAEWRARQTAELTAVNPDDATAAEPAAQRDRLAGSIRLSPVASAIKRLGGTPPKIAESLRSQLPAEDIKVLVQLLMRDA